MACQEPCEWFLHKYVPLIFYLRPKLACDSIAYMNGKDSDLRNSFIKSCQLGIVDISIGFRHSSDAHKQLQASKRILV